VKARVPVHQNSESNVYVCIQHALRFAVVGLQYISLLLVSFVCSLSKHGRAGGSKSFWFKDQIATST